MKYLFAVVVKKHFRQTFCPASCSRCIFKNLDSRERKVFFRDRLRLHAIACDRMRSHGGSQESSHVQQGGLNSTCFHFHHRQTLQCLFTGGYNIRLSYHTPKKSPLGLGYAPLFTGGKHKSELLSMVSIVLIYLLFLTKEIAKRTSPW